MIKQQAAISYRNITFTKIVF